MTIKQFFRVVEIRTKIVSVSSFLLALLWIFKIQASFDVLLAALFFVSMLMVDMGTTGLNSFYDYMNGTDDKRHNRETDKVLVYQGVSPGQTLLVSLGLFLGAGILGLLLGFLTGRVEVIVWGGLSLLVGYLYNGGPLPLSRTPLGEIFAGGFLGTVLMMILGLVLLGRWEPDLFRGTLPSALMIASILTVNNTCDRVGDREAGRWTLSILMGSGPSQVLILLLGLGANLLVLETLLQDFHILGAVLGGLFFLGQAVGYIKMMGRGFSHETKGPSMGSISQIFGFYTLGYAAVLAGSFF